jgi:hypothetical protein
MPVIKISNDKLMVDLVVWLQAMFVDHVKYLMQDMSATESFSLKTGSEELRKRISCFSHSKEMEEGD